MSGRVPWTRVKHRKNNSKPAFKTRKGVRTHVVFKEAPAPSKRIYQYIVKKPVRPVRVEAADIDPNDPDTKIPRYFTLEPGMMLTSGFNKRRGNSVGYLTFGMLHQAAGNDRNRYYNVTVHADALGDEIVPYSVSKYIKSLSRPPRGSTRPVHPSVDPNAEVREAYFNKIRRGLRDSESKGSALL